MNTIKDNFSFLFATRFWALVIGAVMFYLKAKGYVGTDEMILANTILSGFIIVKTIDRNIGDAKEGVTTVSIPSTVSSVQATTDTTSAPINPNDTTNTL